MTTIYHDGDADLAALDGRRVAVIGYGNQGRSWALNLRDSVSTSPPASATTTPARPAEADGFAVQDVEAASDADVICILVPDDAIPSVPLSPEGRRAGDRGQRLHAGLRPARSRRATSASWRRACSAPRCAAATRRASASSPASACTATPPATPRRAPSRSPRRIGGLKQGAIELTAAPGGDPRPRRRAGAVAGPAPGVAELRRRDDGARASRSRRSSPSCSSVGEVERTYRLLRLEGYAAQMEHHSPTSQYGQLSRVPEFTHLDVAGADAARSSTASRAAPSPTSGTPSATPASPGSPSSRTPPSAPAWPSSKPTSARQLGETRWNLPSLR